jgi:hypothetical protein
MSSRNGAEIGMTELFAQRRLTFAERPDRLRPREQGRDASGRQAGGVDPEAGDESATASPVRGDR